MPTHFPDRVDPETGQLVERPYYTVPELAGILRTTERTVYQKMRDGVWPYTRIVRTPYFSPENITEIVGLGAHESGTRGGLHAEQGRNGNGNGNGNHRG